MKKGDKVWIEAYVAATPIEGYGQVEISLTSGNLAPYTRLWKNRKDVYSDIPVAHPTDVEDLAARIYVAIQGDHKNFDADVLIGCAFARAEGFLAEVARRRETST